MLDASKAFDPVVTKIYLELSTYRLIWIKRIQN